MLSSRFVSASVPSAALVSLLLFALPRHMLAQTAPSVSTLTINGGQSSADLTCAVGGSQKGGTPAPTGTVTFTDLTESQMLGTATLSGSAAYSLQPFATQTLSFSGQADFSYMTTADFRGNGVQDIAFNYENPVTQDIIVAVLLGNGDGTFQVSSTIALGDRSYGDTPPIAADVNSDGKLDLILPYWAGDDNTTMHIAVLLGNGDGTFQPPIVSSFAIGQVWDMAVGDFNGDGHPDLAVVTDEPPDVIVTILSGDGSGDFTQGASYSAATFTEPTGGGAEIRAADLRNNGKLDLIVLPGQISSVQEPEILLGNGDGTFAAPQPIAANPASPAVPLSFEMGYFTGSGFPDIAVYTESDPYPNVVTPEFFQIYPGKGDGTFAQGSINSTPGSDGYFTGRQIFVGDFHGNGHQDVLLSGPVFQGASVETWPIAVFTGAGDGSFQFTGQFDLGAELGTRGSTIVPGKFVANGPAAAESIAYVSYDLGLSPAQVGTIIPVLQDTATLRYTLTPADQPEHNLECSYAGDSNYSSSVSAAVPYTIPTTPAGLTSPTPGSAVTGPTAKFAWSSTLGATGYVLWLGTAPGTNDLYNSGATTGLSVTATGLPSNAEIIYARLFTNFPAGFAQKHVDYVFNAAPAALTSPTPGSMLAGAAATFTWNAVTGSTGYALWLGTAQGAKDLYNTGVTTGLSASATGLPTGGETIYARLYTYYSSNSVFTDYVFTAATVAAIISPAPGSVLPGPQVTFIWSPGLGATDYVLWLGTRAGAHDILYTGALTDISVTLSGLPTNGETVYVRLFSDLPSGTIYSDYTYTAATSAALTSPAPGSVLTGAQVTFNWTAASGVAGYILHLGTVAGAYDIRTSGPIAGTQVTFTGLPTNSETIKARLYTLYPNNTVYTDYVFTAAPQSVLISPAPGSTLTGTDLTFTWSSVAQATGYILRLGTTPGAYDVRTSGPVTGTSVAFSALPANGETIYASMCTLYPSSRVCAPYVYTAETQTTLISPAPNSTLTGPEVTFNWSPVTGATGYLLRLGTTVGGFDLRTSGPITANQVTFSGLPVNGETIHARLFTIYPSGSAYTDYVLTAAP